ncbi:MAG: hypothetical protein WBG08_14645 [Litorimonas sp.]
MTGGALASGLIGFMALWPSLGPVLVPAPDGNYIEARLCNSGRIIRIPLPGEDPDPDMPMPCHAVCSRSDVDGKPGRKVPRPV